MRVAYVSPYPPQRDGIGDYTAALAEATRAEGHEVGVIVPRRGPAGAPEVLGHLGSDAALREFDPDVVHVQFGVAAFGTRVPALLWMMRRLRGRGTRMVVTAHEVTRDTALLRAPGRALYRRLAGLADLLIVHTATARDELFDMGAPLGSVVVVPHHRRPPPPPTTDADTLRARHGIDDAPLLLAFGFVHVDKGLGDLVGGLGRLPRGAAHVVVAGDVRRRSGAFRAFELPDRLHLAQVRRRVARLGLEPFVHFTGYVPSGEVAPWFDAADAAVLPYRRIEQSSVGSLAAALGVPVLTSTAGSLTEDYGDPRWSFPPAAPNRLAEVLAAFLAEPRQAAPRAARPAAGADIAAIAEATLNAYARVPPRRTEGRPAAQHA